jgi:polar amino acid transport system substrate-binding protein
MRVTLDDGVRMGDYRRPGADPIYPFVSTRWHLAGLAGVLVTLALLLAATAAGSGETAAAIPGCAPGALPLKTPGTLTLATDNPAPRPWWNGTPQAPWKRSNPYTGKGFESAVAYAVAKRLGFPMRAVTWMPLSAAQAQQPGTKAFDLYLGRVRYSQARDRDVDFSNAYYLVPQALLTRTMFPVARVKTIEGLAFSWLGVPNGSPSHRYLLRWIRPRVGPMVYDSYETALPALVDGTQIQGIVMDLPTAYLYKARLAKGMIVGQFPIKSKERFVFVLQQGSPLRSCVNKALAKMWADGTMQRLRSQWLTPAGGGRLLR